jgi:hypothetical protein
MDMLLETKEISFQDKEELEVVEEEGVRIIQVDYHKNQIKRH